jgi:hypothetical protein
VPTKPTWSLGEVVAISKDQVRVTVQLEDGTVSAFLRDEVRGFDAAHLDPKVFDLGTLNDLNEAAVLSVLCVCCCRRRSDAVMRMRAARCASKSKTCTRGWGRCSCP